MPSTPAEKDVSRVKPAARRTRLPPNERETQIVEGAIRYFAEVGFAGQTRELAKRMGIANALLFRYFPTKEALIDRVYQRVYLGRWRPEWEDWLKDREQPLERRLKRFYASYLAVILTYEWIRIFFFAGLRGVNINDRYLAVLRDRVVTIICNEVRHTYQLPAATQSPITSLELDAVWGLQGQILYIAVRKYIYEQPIEAPEKIAEAAIDVFLAGIPAVSAAAVKSGGAPDASEDLAGSTGQS
jgi:AcrR family transcriptional regulator